MAAETPLYASLEILQGITLTFGDAAENHKGMQILGHKGNYGLSQSDLQAIQSRFPDISEMVNLTHTQIDDVDSNPAYVLILRNGIEALNVSPLDLKAEQDGLQKDTKAFMYGRVVNKKARHNLCFDDFSQEPNYELGQGRVYNFESVPILSSLRLKLQTKLNETTSKSINLKCEGNYYYNVSRCGIGFHGDTERSIVVGVRLGASFPLVYQAYYKNEVIPNSRKEILLSNGDIYFMSEQAVGANWKSRNKITWRHAAGCDKFTS